MTHTELLALAEVMDMIAADIFNGKVHFPGCGPADLSAAHKTSRLQAAALRARATTQTNGD